MKKVSKLSILFLAAFLMIGSTTSVWAQNPVTTNPGKSSGHISDTIQKKISKFEEKMRSISQSKFAKTIGKGIEKAKGAMKWAKSKIQKVQSIKKKVMESKAYKAALLAKEVAEEGKKLKALEDKREEELAALKTKTEIEKETLQAKLKIAKENYKIGLQILEEDQKEASSKEYSSEEKTDLEDETLSEEDINNQEEAAEPKEIDEIDNKEETFEEEEEEEETTLSNAEENLEAYKMSSESDIEEIEKQIKMLELSSKKREAELIYEFAQEIYDEKDKIVELTNKGKEIAGAKSKKQEKTPQEEAQDVEELFIDKGPVSLEKAANNQKRRSKKVSENMLETINTANEKTSETEEIKAEQETTGESSETMDGTSEAMQHAVEDLGKQLDRLYELLEGDLKAIQTSTYVLMASMNMKGSLDISTMIDMCNYSKQGCPEGLGFSDLKNMVEKTVKSATEKAAEVKGMVNQAQDMAQQATQAVQQATDNVKDVQNSVSDVTGNLSSMGI